jgi:phosphatidate cytidylyltransferase
MYINWQANPIKRLYTGAFIVLGLVLSILLRVASIWIFDCIALMLACTAVFEVMRAKKAEQKGVSIYYLMAYIVSAYAIYVLGLVSNFGVILHISMQLLVIFVFFVYTILMNYMDKDFQKQANLKKEKPGAAANKSGREFIKLVIYPFILLACLIPLNHMEMYSMPRFATLGLILVFAISCCTDSFAYCVGHTFKGPKLCPKISPKKTISGAIGGLFGGVVGTCATLMILLGWGESDKPLNNYLMGQIGGGYMAVQLLFVCIGIVGSILTQAGDIYASWIKRRAGIKDYGNFLPGHGGAMDRLDGVSWNAMFIFITFAIIAAL